METKVLLGRRIRELRQRRGFTIQRLAELSRIGAKYVGEIERGRENPTFVVLEKLGKALSVKIHHLLNFEHTLSGKRALRKRLDSALGKFSEAELQFIYKVAVAMKD